MLASNCIIACRCLGLQSTSGEPEFASRDRRGVDRSYRFDERETFNKFEDLYLNLQSVSRDHRHQESHLIDRSQYEELAGLRSRSCGLGKQNGRRLADGFHDESSWHHGELGEMPHELNFVSRDILGSSDALARFERDYGIDH